MATDIHKTVIVTGASQGIGAGLVKAFLDRRYNVVATSRSITKTGGFKASDKLELVDGSIADPSTATRIVETAKRQFGTIGVPCLRGSEGNRLRAELQTRCRARFNDLQLVMLNSTAGKPSFLDPSTPKSAVFSRRNRGSGSIGSH